MELLEKLKIDTNNYSLYETALTHTSYSHENDEVSYERLEFLGDAVLELIMSDYLYKQKQLEEGEMTKMRASYVCENALYMYAKDLGYDKYIRLGEGEIKPNSTIMADVFEAIIGAMYLDKGYEFTRKKIINIIIPYIEKKVNFLKDYKSELQELVQTVKKSVEYKIISESGPSHNRHYVCEVIVNNIKMGTGSGSSKKQAEQEAAKEALLKQAKI